jgi:membrane-bound lytic murein transglycosylase D
VRLKKYYVNSIPLILLALSGCSSFPGEVASVAEATAVHPQVNTANAVPHVLEALVLDAVQHSEQIQKTSSPNAATAEITPVVPTIPMTPNRIVEQTINNYLQNNRGVLRAWAERSQVYFPMIEQIFAEEAVPDELKYLAIGESGLNPTVSSPAGAVGMWQFMAATARGEGLRVDNWVDERRDPEKATRAAARHLKALSEDYNGRWHLAVAGYNCSYRCITRAVKRAGYSMEEPPSYWDVYGNLPKETRDFVPKFIATALIISNPGMYGIETQELGQELTYDIVKVKGMLALEDAARMAGTDVPTLRKLNPSLLRTTTPDDAEPYALKIPLESYATFVRNFEKAAPTAISGTGDYVVKSGDTLGKIAMQHKVSVKELQDVNGIDGHMININQKLQIPGHGGMGKVQLASTEREFVAYGLAPFKPIQLAKEFALVHQSGSTPEKPLLAVSLNQNIIETDEGAMSLVPTIYRVESGDTLGAIARRFGVSVASIQTNNNLAGAAIFPNQELTIHSATNIVDPPQTINGRLTYQVQNGDNLYVIARRFGVSVDNLKRMNDLDNNVIYPGQNLQIN